MDYWKVLESMESSRKRVKVFQEKKQNVEELLRPNLETMTGQLSMPLRSAMVGRSGSRRSEAYLLRGFSSPALSIEIHPWGKQKDTLQDHNVHILQTVILFMRGWGETFGREDVCSYLDCGPLYKLWQGGWSVLCLKPGVV